MSTSLLLVTSVLYLGVAVGYALDERPHMALAFVAYAIANAALAAEAWL